MEHRAGNHGHIVLGNILLAPGHGGAAMALYPLQNGKRGATRFQQSTDCLNRIALIAFFLCHLLHSEVSVNQLLSQADAQIGFVIDDRIVDNLKMIRIELCTALNDIAVI